VDGIHGIQLLRLRPDDPVPQRTVNRQSTESATARQSNHTVPSSHTVPLSHKGPIQASSMRS
jgi:hypothetical protein